MNVDNVQFNIARALSFDKKAVAAAKTLKVGLDSDNFHIDNPIEVNVANDYNIVVPNGRYFGQEIFLVATAATGGKAVTVATTLGDDCTLDAAGEFALLRWCGSTIGWKKVYFADGV